MLSFAEAFAEMPLIAILRGVTPNEIVAIAEALHDAGIRLVEVPLNSPDPLDSIARLGAMAGRMVWGAGTVTKPDEVDAIIAVGGTLIVSPHTDVTVIAQAVKRGGIPVPGFASATEAFAATAAGAQALKLFPASTYGPGHVRALRAVLPAAMPIVPVGGVGPEQMLSWLEAGAQGFGLGSDLYKPGMEVGQVHDRAVAAVSALRNAWAKGA